MAVILVKEVDSVEEHFVIPQEFLKFIGKEFITGFMSEFVNAFLPEEPIKVGEARDDYRVVFYEGQHGGGKITSESCCAVEKISFGNGLEKSVSTYYGDFFSFFTNLILNLFSTYPFPDLKIYLSPFKKISLFY